MTLSTGGFRQVVAFPPAPIATGWSDPCREGLAPSQEPCLSTAHDFTITTTGFRFSVHTRGQDRQNETEQPDHSASLGDSITASTRIRPASDWRFLGPTLRVTGHARCISNFYRLLINHVQEIGVFSLEPKPPTARAERLSYPKATIRHFD